MKDTSGLEKAEEGEEQRAAHPHANHFSTNGLNATYWGAGGHPGNTVTQSSRESTNRGERGGLCDSSSSTC